MIKGSLQELKIAVITCIGENFWENVIGTSTNLLVSWSYV